MADRVPWHPKLTYRTGGNDTFTVVEDTPKCDPNPRPQCDHICLGKYGHDGPHYYGYRSGTPVDEINRLIDEIERLQEKNEWLDSHVGALIIGFRENKAEIERLRALIAAFVSAWERSDLGENNGSEYFNVVHAMRQAVRGD